MKNLSNLSIITILFLVITFSTGCVNPNDPNNPTSTTTVKDIDGNAYHTVKIGTQTWMVENLKTAKYRNGDAIPNVTDATAWSKLTTGAYCNYNNDAATGTKYGKLYNYSAVTDSRNIAPTGWHVATNDEWTALYNSVSANLGSSGSVAKALANITDWASSTQSGAIGNDLTKNNISGFTAMPGGGRSSDGSFSHVGDAGVWWVVSPPDGSYIYLWSESNTLMTYGFSNQTGLSVRCIKDYDALAAVETSETLPTSSTTATGGGKITDVGGVGGAPVTARGICWATTENPTITNSKTTNGSGSGTFTSAITGLNSETTYYVRAYATNSVGTTYGTQKSFSTKLPTLTTATVSSIKSTTAIGGGTITDVGGASISARGVCWSTKTTPTIADSKTTDGVGIGSFSSSITGLNAGTTYFIRAYAITSVGTGYGVIYQITTPLIITFNPNLTYGSVTDIDGNVYKTITIGTQTWMAENLKTTKYNDGTDIPNVTDNAAWAALSTPAYCWYNNDATNKATYGALYNRYAVNIGELAPTGWHVATYAEWNTLITYLGGSSTAGGRLKETGTGNWESPNTGATNDSGFTALPGGWRGSGQQGYLGLWWLANSDTQLRYNYSNADNVIGRVIYYTDGKSVRCIKD